jgi:uncharacterized protein YkwD
MKKRFRAPLIILVALFLLLTSGLALAAQIEDAILGRPLERPITTTQQVNGFDPQSYLPYITGKADLQPWINTQNKNEVGNFYLTTYLASNGVPPNWNGDVENCDAGTTSEAFKQAMLTRINYFRSMAGIPPVVSFKADYNDKAQQAALMMSANNMLSHFPTADWECYTAEGAEGAANSNLYLGVNGPPAISGYVEDPGIGNEVVGHRRWILFPQTQYMGTGDIPPAGVGNPRANALWVFDLQNIGGPRPDTREEYVAWPPPGYVPYQVVFPRWSFAYAFADLTNATVTMTKNGQPLSLQQHPVVYGYGERTMVWEPNDIFGQAPGSDITYNVTITNVIINGQPNTFNYQVIVFAP